MYYPMFRQMRKNLAQVDTWFDKATDYAKSRSFDPNVLVGARLAPDQFPLLLQVQIACDTIKTGASRLTGKEAPADERNETTIDDLRARIKSVTQFLDSLKEKDFDHAATRTVTLPRWEGKTMTGHDYLLEHVVPNFFFHASHTYAILRHNGVPLGKSDYIGPLTQRKP
jgi:hypothetical protein